MQMWLRRDGEATSSIQVQGLAPLLPGGRIVHCRGSTDITEVGRLLQFVLGHADDRMIRVA